MSCSLSTHVLDTAAGRPAAGVMVELLRDGDTVISAETDADGRARLAEDLVAGLVFAGPHRVDRLVVGGEDVVRGGALVRADEGEIARAHRVQARRLTP